jgi:hypothetical protein
VATAPPAFFSRISIGVKSSPFRGDPGAGFEGLFPQKTLVVSGVTRDNTGAPLGGCTVKLYDTPTDTVLAQTVSDGSGNYAFNLSLYGPFYCVAYLPGSPDVAGTTIDTLVAV